MGKQGTSGKRAQDGADWRKTHTGWWPLYQTAGRERTLAWLDHGRTLHIEGEDPREVSDYGDIATIAVDRQLDLYVSHLMDANAWPYLIDALSDVRATVLASRHGGPVGIQWREGNTRANLVSSTVWHVERPNDLFLAALRELFQYVGVGVFTTPAALGEALWRQTREGDKLSCPGVACQRDLHEHVVGARSDYFAAGRSFAELYEQDMRSAYVHFVERVPSGTAVRTLREPADSEAATWFASCVVEIPQRLRTPYGPVPVRSLDKGLIVYPNQTGTWGQDGSLWLWKETVLSARDAGMRVSVGPGWAWPMLDTGNGRWATLVSRLRYAAPNRGIADWLKAAAVMAVGRQGSYDKLYLVLASDPRHSELDAPVILPYGDVPITGAFLHCEDRTYDQRRWTLPHVFGHVVMSCRESLYQRMLGEVAGGNDVLATNTDALFTVSPTRQAVSNDDTPGVWRERHLHRRAAHLAMLPKKRWLDSLEHSAMPGWAFRSRSA